MLGGSGNARILDSKERAAVLNEKNAIETIAGRTFTVFEPVLIKVQVVSGFNYLVKILVDNDEYIHVKLYLPLEYKETKKAEIVFVKTGKTLDDKM